MSLLTSVFGVECSNCGASNSTEARYCQNCGAKLPTRSADQQEPDNYTPEHLRQEVLNSRSSMEGERKEVTVLFVDIQDSQKLARTLSDEDWHQLLDRFFAILTHCIHQFEGTVNQYTGDGIMALFGAPIAHEDHAQRACYAALHIQHELQAFTQDIKQHHNHKLLARIGLHSGQVIVGRIGDDLRMDYTAQGATVGLAARLENLAKGGQICLSASTAELAGDAFSMKPLGRHKLKGENHDIELFELGSVRAVRTRFRDAQYKLTPFTGRDALMHKLQHHFNAILTGKKPLSYISIHALAGIGKSRLCYEFASYNQQQHQALYLEAHGVPHGQHLPLLPVIALARHYFGINRDDNQTTAKASIKRRLQKFNLDSDTALQTILDFMGLDADKDVTTVPTPHQSEHSAAKTAVPLFELLQKIAAAGSHFEPTIIVLDDLHSFDIASLKFIDQLMQTLCQSDARVLVIANYRPTLSAETQSYLTKFSDQSFCAADIALEPLDAQSTRSLLDRWLGKTKQLQQLKKMIVERAAGNPFFVEAIINDLQDNHILEGKLGQFVLTEKITSVKVPATIQALLTSRVDRLPDDQKRLLQVAAVIGRSIPDRILYKASKLGYRRFQLALAQLLKQRLLFRQSLYPHALYNFTHPLMQESIYQSFLSNHAQDIHRYVGRAAAEYFARSPEQASSVARHYDLGGDAKTAIDWYQKAAKWARDHSIKDAIDYWQRTIELSENLPDQPAALIRLRACARVLQLASRRGMQPKYAITLYELGLTIAKQLAKNPATNTNESQAAPQTIADFTNLLHLSMGSIYAFSGQLTASTKLYRLAAQQADSDPQRIIAWVGLVFSQHMLGQNRQAIATLKEGIRLADGNYNLGAEALGRSPLLSLELHYVWLAIDLNETTIAFHDHSELPITNALKSLKKTAQNRQETQHVAWIYCLRGLLAWRQHDATVALQMANQANELAAQAGNRFVIALARVVEIRALVQLQEWETAKAIATDLLNFITEHQIGVAFTPYLQAELSQINRQKTRLDDAVTHAKESLLLAEQYGTKGFAIEALLASCEARLAKTRQPNQSNTSALSADVCQQIQAWLHTAEQYIAATGLVAYNSNIAAIRQQL